MKRINVLDIETSNKIAAGEVVERPFSVVKELVENSIDAGSKNISVEITEGGQKSIKIVDDGSGIYPEDIEKAFLPHATSKITDIKDVFAINTLGFRGEALASIASIADVTLKSRTEEFQFGKEIAISGGKIEYIKEVGMNVGTTIEVKNLFFNVPARQKFLKSSQREAALISDIISRLALANHKISFHFTSNGKKVLSSYGGSNLTDTIRCIYGKTISDNIINFEKHSDTTSVHGYIGNAEASKGSRNYQSVFVNNRYIKNKLVTAAVENAFKSFLTVNKFPFFILFIDIFPELIDVNVHPTKSEIKFEEDRQIFKIVFDAVHEAIRNSLKNSFDIEESKGEYPFGYASDFNEKQLVQIPMDLAADRVKIEELMNNERENKNIYTEKVEEEQRKETQFIKENIKENVEVEGLKITTDQFSTEEEVKSSTIDAVIKIPKFSSIRIIGQFNSTYIIGESENSLYLIDQHAAHEKILFEKYKNDIKQGDVLAQILLMPEVLELSIEEYLYYSENSELFERSGFQIEIFGDNTISIREVPMLLGNPDVKGLFMSMIENLRKLGSGEIHDAKYDTIAKIACKAAIKARKPLSEREMETLVDELRYIENPFTCPHGRPTIIKLGLTEIEKRFKRIQ